MSAELATLGAYLWFFLAVGVLFLVLAPLLIWKNTASTLTLLGHILEEQERTNDLLALQLEQNERAMRLVEETMPKPPPAPTATQSTIHPTSPSEGQSEGPSETQPEFFLEEE